MVRADEERIGEGAEIQFRFECLHSVEVSPLGVGFCEAGTIKVRPDEYRMFKVCAFHSRSREFGVREERILQFSALKIGFA